MNIISKWISEQLAKGMTPAQRLRAALGADLPEAFAKPQHRYATPRRLPAGRRAGAYGRGLRNWINNKQDAAQAQRLAKKMAAIHG